MPSYREDFSEPPSSPKGLGKITLQTAYELEQMMVSVQRAPEDIDLSSLRVSIVHEDAEATTPLVQRCNLVDFIPQELRERHGDKLPGCYQWALFQFWLQQAVDYVQEEDDVYFCNPNWGGSGKDDALLPIKDDRDWAKILADLKVGRYETFPYEYLYFVVRAMTGRIGQIHKQAMTRAQALQRKMEEKQKRMGEHEAALAEGGTLTMEGEGEEPVVEAMADSKQAGKIAVSMMSPRSVSNVKLSRAGSATLPSRKGTPASAAGCITSRRIAKGNLSLHTSPPAFALNNGSATPSASSYHSESVSRSSSPLSSVLGSEAEGLVEEATARSESPVVDIDASLGDFATSQDRDDDYGAVDLGVIDAYIPAYNACDSEADWLQVLDFFDMPATAFPYRADPRKQRVGVKKFPGLTNTLFDYQLMGVFNLLRNVGCGNDVAGGFLADDPGLGKSIEMFAMVALAAQLRKNRAEVLDEWRAASAATAAGPARSGAKRTTTTSGKKHCAEGTTDARTCRQDRGIGFRCYCYSALTRQLADALPQGPSLMLVPPRSCTQVYRDARKMLDQTVFKVRMEDQSAAKEDHLQPADVVALRADITARPSKAANADGEWDYWYRTKPGQDSFVVIVPFTALDDLRRRVVGNVKPAPKITAGAADPAKMQARRDALMPGIVMFDEFHELGADSKVFAWLCQRKEFADNTARRGPLAFFASGTPFADSPADMRAALAYLQRPSWTVPAEGSRTTELMAESTVDALDKVSATYADLLGRQGRGDDVPLEEAMEFRKAFGRILRRTMVRRLGTDSFRGVTLTSIGPLKVTIADHPVPADFKGPLQQLADLVRSRAAEAVAAGKAADVATALRRERLGPELLLPLRLASTFPSTIATSLDAADPVNFTDSEILAEMARAGGDLRKTIFWSRIPGWASSSAKLRTVRETVERMLADTTPVPGQPGRAKKMTLFAPLAAEAMVLYGYLVHKAKTMPGLKPVWLHAGMTPAERQVVLDQFARQDNAACNVLVSTMAVGGTGLNLQMAKYSTITGLGWSKSENQQAYYRTHRVGQKQETSLQLLVSMGNPADRRIQTRYKGGRVEEADEAWRAVVDGEGLPPGLDDGSLVSRHIQVAGKEEAGEKKAD